MPSMRLISQGTRGDMHGAQYPMGFADGSSTLLFGAFGGSIDIDSEWDGRVFDLAATDVGGGVWRIDRVGGVPADGRIAAAALVLSDLECRSMPSAADPAIRMDGAVQARAGVSGVGVTGASRAGPWM